MKQLRRLVDQAAMLSLATNSEASRDLAVRQRIEASRAIDRAEARLQKLRAILALFPVVKE